MPQTVSCDCREGSEEGGETRQRPRNPRWRKWRRSGLPKSTQTSPIWARRRRVLGGIPAFLEVGTRGRSRARWDPASVQNGPKNNPPPPPPPIPTRGMRKGPDCGQSSKKESFHPKRGLTRGVCLTGVALNRRILREKKAKKGALGVGSKGSSPRSVRAPKPQEIAPNPRQQQHGRPTRKGRESPAAKPPKKTCRKGRK